MRRINGRLKKLSQAYKFKRESKRLHKLATEKIVVGVKERASHV